MGWKWTFTKDIFPVDIYYKELWETSYKGVYAKVIEHFISTLYKILFDIKAPCMSNKARASFPEVTN